LKGKDHLENLDVRKRIILKAILNAFFMSVQIANGLK
jgi:hypothetical protein